MREVAENEVKQRGCLYCADVLRRNDGRSAYYCKYDECPYHELDNISDYVKDFCDFSTIYVWLHGKNGGGVSG